MYFLTSFLSVFGPSETNIRPSVDLPEQCLYEAAEFLIYKSRQRWNLCPGCKRDVKNLMKHYEFAEIARWGRHIPGANELYWKCLFCYFRHCLLLNMVSKIFILIFAKTDYNVPK